ncbi:protein shisa-6-like [Carcharodon carcharias]|uniref:protein shisa-6-like n=1 Tax=Carcharodon carcharias TaxID=13397 RepID=UPI001B7E2426|nr:protein shisa-6-like [Carcharodon carcharias]
MSPPGLVVALLLIGVAGGVAGTQNASLAAAGRGPRDEGKGEGVARVPPATVGDTCQGYYDVMGQYDPPFNCSSGTYLYCCGTCHYRFCCEFRSYQLLQGGCSNYHSPDWANTPLTSSAVTENDRYDPAKDRTNSTVYIICGVLTLSLAVGIGVKVAFRKVAQQPHDLNVSRALVDILRHQAVSVSNVERNNQTNVGTNSSQSDTTPHVAKSQYTPVKISKVNQGKSALRCLCRLLWQHLHKYKTGKHSECSGNMAVILDPARSPTDRQARTPAQAQGIKSSLPIPRYHQRQHLPKTNPNTTTTGGLSLHLPRGDGYYNQGHQAMRSPTHAGTLPLDRSRRNNVNPANPCGRQNALLTSCSYHNLSHLPPSYEMAMKPELNKYSSLKRLAAKDVDEYCKRRHLAEVMARGTLPLRAMKTDPAEAPGRDFAPNTRRVMSQDRLLGEGLPALPPLPPPRLSPLAYATIARGRLLSPDRLAGAGGRPLGKKALSQSNVCAPAAAWLDRHQIVKMNSHPPAAGGGGAGGPQPPPPAAGSPRAPWGEAAIAERRHAFAAKRHSTVEQLHFIPGHHPPTANQQQQQQPPPLPPLPAPQAGGTLPHPTPAPTPAQHPQAQPRTGSKTEVTV